MAEERTDLPATREAAKAPFASDSDDALIREMLAPPPVEDAQASLYFWRQRRRELPVYRRRARREAELRMASVETGPFGELCSHHLLHLAALWATRVSTDGDG